MLWKMFARGFITLFMIIVLSPSADAADGTEDLLTDSRVLSLRSAIARGVQKNLDLQVEQLNIPINREDVTVNDAEFDLVLESSIYSRDQETPTSSAFTTGGLDIYRQTGGTVGLRKKFEFGLESRLSFETYRSTNNSFVDALRPQYRNILIFNFTQPLLRDFGTTVNRANVRISQNQVREATKGYVDRAQRIGEEIELAYYDLAEPVEVLRYRIESRELAEELLEGNRKKFERGVIPISEVQEAETAVVSRDEQVVFARQQVETARNRLKDLIEIRPGDPLGDNLFITEKIRGVNKEFPHLEWALALALEKRPDLERRRIEIAKQDILIEYYRNQRLPRVDLEATLGVNGLSGGDRPVVDFRTGGLMSSPYEGGYSDSFSNMTEGEGKEWLVGLRLSYPLGNRVAKARYRRADWEKRQAIYRLTRLEGAVETEVRNALVTVRRSLERFTIAEDFERLAETTLNQEMERLKRGLSDTFRILDFQNDLIEARIRKVTALVDFNQGLASLYRAMGVNLDRFHIVAEIDTTRLVTR